MKKILLSTLCFAAMHLYAQTPKWVPTTTQTRNAILEEFTGYRCGFCPDGHRIATGLVNQYPGQVFLVNIHSPYFGSPQTGDVGVVDLTTAAGTALDAASGVTGYPAGNINRSTTPWAGDRSLWANQVAGNIAQNSVVNVYVKASVDFTTRILTTEVEVYYTGTSANSRNYLTVALTQDGILGPQHDYGNYNPTNWINGQYLHNHVLRQLINTYTSAAIGEPIDSANVTGHYFYRKYTTTIPASYSTSSYSDGGINLAKLNVVAFVSENSNGGNILSGFGTPVDFSASLKADLSLTDLTVKPTSYCFTSINPKATVTNVFDSTVTSFDVSAFINGVANVKHYTGSLAKNASTTIDWGVIPVTNTGTFTLTLQGFKNIVGLNSVAKIDINNLNDASPFYSTFGFNQTAFTTMRTSFEGGMPANFAFDLSQNTGMKIITGSGTTNYGAFSTPSAVLFYLLGSNGFAGKPASIIFGDADFTNNNSPGMSFYYAYSDGGQNGTAPTLAVSVSTDCGATWNQVNSLTAVQTGIASNPTNLYVPKYGEYKFVNTDLTAYKNQKVLLKITGTPGTSGNAMYVDEIVVNSFAKLGINEVTNSNQFEIFPNPATSNITIKLPDAKNATIRVMDVTGKEVINTIANGLETVVDCNQLNNGLYIIEVTVDGRSSTQKLVISK